MDLGQVSNDRNVLSELTERLASKLDSRFLDDIVTSVRLLLYCLSLLEELLPKEPYDQNCWHGSCFPVLGVLFQPRLEARPFTHIYRSFRPGVVVPITMPVSKDELPPGVFFRLDIADPKERVEVGDRSQRDVECLMC